MKLLWDVWYVITLPIRLLLLLIIIIFPFIIDDDFPPIVRDGEYYWYIEDFCEESDIATKADHHDVE